MSERTPEQVDEEVERVRRLLDKIADDARIVLGLIGPESTARAVAGALVTECTPGQLASLAAVATVRLIEAGWKPEASGG